MHLSHFSRSNPNQADHLGLRPASPLRDITLPLHGAKGTDQRLLGVSGSLIYFPVEFEISGPDMVTRVLMDNNKFLFASTYTAFNFGFGFVQDTISCELFCFVFLIVVD